MRVIKYILLNLALLVEEETKSVLSKSYSEANKKIIIASENSLGESWLVTGFLPNNLLFVMTKMETVGAF